MCNKENLYNFAELLANSTIDMHVDSTIRPGQQSGDVQALQREELTRNVEAGHLAAGQMNMNRAEGVACPTCGTVNDPDALFCASCGKPLRMGTCPNCGTEIDLDADYCETCHHYIRQDVCSFCGAKIAVGEIYCHECGSPRGGIVCPVCNTLNSFAFCKQCGTPLTEEARMLMSELQRLPDYQLLSKTARELETLDMEVPYNSERDVVRDQMNDKLRERVLLLLAKDKGVPNPVIPKKVTKKLSKEEL